MQASYLKRANLVFICVFVVLGIILIRLAYIQLVSHGKYLTLQDQQADIKTDIQPETGMILDSKGEILALSRMVNSLYVVPDDLNGHNDLIQQIAGILQINGAELIDKIQKSDEQHKHFLWVKRRIDDDAAKKIAALNIKGVGLKKEYKRFYPKDMLAAQLIGYRGLDERALDGVEVMADKYLKGEPGYEYLNRDARHHVFTSELPAKPAVPGYNVTLTIDALIQNIVERNLADLCRQWNPAGVEAIVLRPYTGEILAMAQMPAFDPNNYQNYPPDVRQNHILTEAYEPGSTFKPFITTAALEHHIFTPNSKLFCENGHYSVKFKRGGRTITDHEPYGTLSLTEVVAHSSNIGMAKVGLATGKENMYNMVKRFGFGRTNNLNLACEHPGLITPLSKWSDYTSTSVPMGYEIAVNTLQLARAYSVFANNGKMCEPQILKEVTDKSGKIIYENKFDTPPREVISSELCRTMDTILRTVVVSGTGVGANLKTYAVAGKTGTARKIGPDKKYSTKNYRSLFASFAPLEKPAIVVLVVVNDPKGAYYAATVAAPTAGKIIDETLKYLNVASRIASVAGATSRERDSMSLPRGKANSR